MRSDPLSKVIRKVEPRAGKIDYDIEGTVAGNWFLEGTVDYGGNVPPNEPPAKEYWKGHLTIAYGYIDPTQLRISIGFDTGINDDLYCNACFGAYGERGNQPDPAMVGPESASALYARNLFNFLEVLVDPETGALDIDLEDEIVNGTLIVHDGKVVHPALIEEAITS